MLEEKREEMRQADEWPLEPMTDSDSDCCSLLKYRQGSRLANHGDLVGRPVGLNRYSEFGLLSRFIQLDIHCLLFLLELSKAVACYLVWQLPLFSLHLHIRPLYSTAAHIE